MTRFMVAALAALVALTLPDRSAAQEVRITPDTLRVELTIRGETVVIERNQDLENTLTGGFAKTSRRCPPFCIHPMSAGEGVETVGELELIEFMREHVEPGTGLLIDSRLPDFFVQGTIPGAVNLPFSTMDESNPYRDEILVALGGRQVGDGWDFSEAMELLAFCNGPWCDQSPRMIRNMMSVGYPAEKLRYYRGGMQMWLLLGMSVDIP